MAEEASVIPVFQAAVFFRHGHLAIRSMAAPAILFSLFLRHAEILGVDVVMWHKGGGFRWGVQEKEQEAAAQQDEYHVEKP